MLHTHSLPLKRPHDSDCDCRTCVKARQAPVEISAPRNEPSFYRPEKLPEAAPLKAPAESPLHPPVIVHLNHERDWQSRILRWLILIMLILIWGKLHGWAQSPTSAEIFYYNTLTGKWTAVSSTNPLPASISGGGSNACASATGSAVPSSACYSGLNIAGNLVGWTGLGLTHANAAAVAIVDGNGNQVTSFGGGTQYTQGTTQASPVGTVAMGINPSNVLNALNQDASGNLLVNLNANSFGTLTVTGATNIFKVSPSTAAISATNPFFDEITDGTNPMGAMANFGTSPGAVKALNVNASIFCGTSGCGTSATPVRIDPTGTTTQPVSLASVPLPTGAATAANQCGTSSPCQVSATSSANSSSNPLFDTPTDSSGNTLAIDPCQRGSKTYININQTANTQLLTGASGKHWYICSFFLPEQTAAQNIALVEGTGTTCGSSTIAVPGTTGGAGTAATGANMAINQGFVLGTGGYAVGQTSVAADNVCLYQSGSTQLSGGLTAVDY